MRKYLKTLLATAVVAFSTFGASQAFAVVAVSTTFNFAGNCFDCARAANDANPEVSATDYAVTGRLVLQGYDVNGGGFTLENFVSFAYDSSNLLPRGLTLVASDMATVEGFFSGDASDLEHRVNLITLPTYEGAVGTYAFFFSEAGRFTVGGGTVVACIPDPGKGIVCHDDVGSGQWSTNQTNNIPEPGSLLLMGGALMALGLIRRRRS